MHARLALTLVVACNGSPAAAPVPAASDRGALAPAAAGPAAPARGALDPGAAVPAASDRGALAPAAASRDRAVSPPVPGVCRLRSAAAAAPADLQTAPPQWVLARGGHELRVPGLQLRPETAVEAPSGELWAVARSPDRSRLLHLRPDGSHEVRDLDVPRGRDTTLALTSAGRPALVFLRRDAGRLTLMVSWSLDPANAIEVDHVELPVAVAELSERTGVDVVAAADGAGIAVAWRPLTDSSLTDVGTPEEPPQTPAVAEVRVRSVAPDGALGSLQRHATRAYPLGGVTGVGPWGLYPSGMTATTLGGHALFAWLAGDAVVAARSLDSTATRIAPSEGAPLIRFRGTDAARELLLFDSPPRVRASRVACE